MVVNLSKMGNQQLLSMETKAYRWLENNAPELTITACGYDLLFAHHTTRVARELLVGSVAALLVISAILIVGLRSIKYGLISLVPNIFPAAVVFGIWALLVGKMNPNTVALFSISIGLVVNDTVHFLNKYLYCRRLGRGAEQSVFYAFETAGPALFITTIALCMGIFALAFSDWVPIQHIVMLLTPIIAVALFLDFFLLPPLLIKIDRGTQLEGVL